jgi:hypothetical protein
MKGQVLFKGEIITKMQNGMGSFKRFFLKNHRARRALFQIMVPRGWEGLQLRNHIYIEENLLLQNHQLANFN